MQFSMDICIYTSMQRFFSIITAQCIAPLGMENGLIPDEDITASSSFDHSNVGPHHGRYITFKSKFST